MAKARFFLIFPNRRQNNLYFLQPSIFLQFFPVASPLFTSSGSFFAVSAMLKTAISKIEKNT
jgi:hypothetical protein